MGTLIRRHRLTLLTALAITILSTIPVPEVKPLEDVPFFDKWVHFLMYGALTTAVWLDRRLARRPVTLPFVIVGMLLVPALFGGLMELVQAYCTTCRSGDWMDFYADAFGAALFTIVCSVANLFWKK